MIYTNTASVLPEEMARLTAAIGGNPNVTADIITLAGWRNARDTGPHAT